MPCFHWPTTSIHENMWNSKSCPEGDPSQKKGVIAKKQMPPITSSWAIGILGDGSAILESYAATRFGRLSAIRWTTILVHLRISRRINRDETLPFFLWDQRGQGSYWLTSAEVLWR